MATYEPESPWTPDPMSKEDTVRLLRDSARLSIIYNAVKVTVFLFNNLDSDEEDVKWRASVIEKICSHLEEIFNSIKCTTPETLSQEPFFRAAPEDLVQIDLECASLGAHLIRGTGAIRDRDALTNRSAGGDEWKTEALKVFETALETLNEMADASPRERLKFGRSDRWRKEYLSHAEQQFHVHTKKEWDFITELTKGMKEYSVGKSEKME